MYMEFHSQDKQDLFLKNNVFKDYKNGFFVDVGAHDGKKINNTLFFENYYNWTGINIEPMPNVFIELNNNRPNCINYNCAISDIDGTAEFIHNKGYTEMLSGLKEYYDNRHIIRRDNEIKSNGGYSELIQVNTKRLETILDENNIKHINYLSIDVEGAEFSVIKSINFNKVFIDIIGFENNYNDTSKPIIKYLQNKNYKMIHKSLDIFMIHNESRFI